MSIFKIRHEMAGGHIHCQLFEAKGPNMTWSCCGDFTVRVEEFDDLQRSMSGVVFEERQPQPAA